MSARARIGRRLLRLPTPEGVELELDLGDLGSRAIAFTVDGLLIVAATFGIGLAAWGFAEAGAPGGLAWAFFFLASFLVRSFYFVVFETRWRGRTPGKRSQRLRVVARDGGPVTVEMTFARNLTREIEVFLPLMVVFAPEAILAGGPGWLSLAALVWAGVLLFLPAMNRQRARLGDLVAGTLVVAEPAVELEPDLAALARADAAGTGLAGRVAALADLVFEPRQLDLYGIRELQVLEEVLRRPPDESTEQLLVAITDKVQKKIGWQGRTDLPPRRFLEAFYAAQRERLEHGLLFGRARREKVEGRLERG